MIGGFLGIYMFFSRKYLVDYTGQNLQIEIGIFSGRTFFMVKRFRLLQPLVL